MGTSTLVTPMFLKIFLGRCTTLYINVGVGLEASYAIVNEMTAVAKEATLGG